MDYRLDLYNQVKKYKEQMTEDDALFCISINKKEGDLLMAAVGDTRVILAVICNEGNYVNFRNEKDKALHDKMKSWILYMAKCILESDNELKNDFINSISKK
jgi:hypothetical protein